MRKFVYPIYVAATLRATLYQAKTRSETFAAPYVQYIATHFCIFYQFFKSKHRFGMSRPKFICLPFFKF